MAQLQEEPAMTAIEEEGIGQEKIYLNVPFEEKEKVNSLGARWDKNLHAWFIPPGVDPESFAKWGRGAVEGQGGRVASRQRGAPISGCALWRKGSCQGSWGKVG